MVPKELRKVSLRPKPPERKLVPQVLRPRPKRAWSRLVKESADKFGQRFEDLIVDTNDSIASIHKYLKQVLIENILISVLLFQSIILSLKLN